jgi:hypothetical protein
VAGAPVPLFLTHPPKAVEIIDRPHYVVSAVGHRFLVDTIADETTVPPISLIVNWTPPAR